ncbi:hypothetical protein ACH5RR_019038 [Cinchona calisaya]|uniref:Uncharacterized protein n=1 Tax=Cinchona calisaya TaxID=153742 RepID=A0ABD2ZN63_9GENT
MLSVINAGAVEVKGWQVHVGLQYNELLVLADGAIVVGESGLPVSIGKNGTVFAGYPMTDLKTAIETVGDYTQIQVQVDRLMESDHVGPFNLGNPGEFTMLEFAQVVRETTDSSATIAFKPNIADDPHKRKPDISKAKELLNLEPKISLREGLPKMVSE